MKRKFIILIIIISIILFTIPLTLVYLKNSMSLGGRYDYGRYGKDNNIVIVCKDNEVDLKIYDKNKQIFSQNKVYHFKVTDKYFYVITKWDDYILIDLKNNEIILDTNDINKISKDHLEVFQRKITFKDLSDKDIRYGNIVSFGDGTVYLEAVLSNTVWLYTQKTENGSHFKKMISKVIKKYKDINNLLYLITGNNNYVVIDYDTYIVLYECDKINKLPEEHQKVFNDGGFINALEIYKSTTQ